VLAGAISSKTSKASGSAENLSRPMWRAAAAPAARAGEDRFMVSRDRRHAGRLLAAQLLPLRSERPVVIALPRGGVPVAVAVARALGAPLDILAVRKLGAPGNPELGVGAIAEDGTAVLDTRVARQVGMTERLLDAAVERELPEESTSRSMPAC
jgi:predicted phosphoribosyltransferase